MKQGQLQRGFLYDIKSFSHELNSKGVKAFPLVEISRLQQPGDFVAESVACKVLDMYMEGGKTKPVLIPIRIDIDEDAPPVGNGEVENLVRSGVVDVEIVEQGIDDVVKLDNCGGDDNEFDDMDSSEDELYDTTINENSGSDVARVGGNVDAVDDWRELVNMIQRAKKSNDSATPTPTIAVSSTKVESQPTQASHVSHFYLSTWSKASNNNNNNNKNNGLQRQVFFLLEEGSPIHLPTTTASMDPPTVPDRSAPIPQSDPTRRSPNRLLKKNTTTTTTPTRRSSLLVGAAPPVPDSIIIIIIFYYYRNALTGRFESSWGPSGGLRSSDVCTPETSYDCDNPKVSESPRFQAILRVTSAPRKKFPADIKSFSHELNSKGVRPFPFWKHRGLNNLEEILVVIRAKFDKAKEEVNSDLAIFAADLVGILEKNVDTHPEWQETIEDLLILARSCAMTSPADFWLQCEGIFEELDDRRQELPPGTLKQLHTRMLFILTRCTRLLQFHKESGLAEDEHVLHLRQSRIAFCRKTNSS
ncbi:hypothetical protein FEM48_Zijuj05G0159600 [Ziziphus jujuba var. spinosa]|uniref:IREH1/IRE-like N-terminal domain-containing protein n=1 Tax=Ziziphus jujuba var. spinosa TaxID=714518 RepID=A0A978VFR3_ZIZJJ|nr:hypothetical protein FEM48_Zijuj05G0159600 [Ziziphus jujuba var. spinosa]